MGIHKISCFVDKKSCILCLMKTVLFAWIGSADLKASQGVSDSGLGPIGQAATVNAYDSLVLLSDHSKRETDFYLRWIRSKTSSNVDCVKAALSAPTHFGEIYEHVIQTLQDFVAKTKNEYKLVFHLSPGTPAMAAVWIIVAKTRFPAELIQSSREAGVQVASVPFDISADYLPDLLRKPDEELVRLSQGMPPDAPEFQDIIHRCALMKRLIAKARRVAPRNIPVLILGESGTGKELLARAIHQSSVAKSGAFVAVNCGAIPKDLLESELFGHEKGAFTGATTARKGYIESAAGGTLFLDEIGELPAYAQVKLLRVLQDNQIVPVGSSHPRTVHFRLIAATNRDLMTEVAEYRFREDLFHRIAVAVLHVPPLREREGDIGFLIDALLSRINHEAKNQPGYEEKHLSASARNLLIQSPWPGNVREVNNTLQRAAVWSSGATIEVQDVREALLPMPSRRTHDVLGRPLGNGLSLPDIMESVATHYLARAMEESAGNKTKAAELVGLPSYQTLTNWLHRYGIENQ